MFISRFFPGGHITSGRIPDRVQQGSLPVPPLIVAPSGAAVWGSPTTPPSGSGAGGVISGPPHPPPPLVPVHAHTADNNIDDGGKRRLPFPVPPQAGFYISDLLYRGGGIWALRRGAASPGVTLRRGAASPGEAARRREEADQARQTAPPASPVSERRPGSAGGDDGGSEGGGTSSHQLKFGIDRILAKEVPKPARSPAACPCGPPARGGGGCVSCTTPASPYLLPGSDPHLPHLPPSSRVIDLNPLHHHHHHQHPQPHQHQHHQHPGQHHHHRPRPQHQHQQHQQQHQGGPYLYRSADFPGPYSVLACDGSSPHQQHQSNSSQQLPHQPGSGSTGKRKRSWSRAVFSHLQRKGLEKRFEVQKYVTKPDRRQLAGLLNLTDAQVKVWFQNRRMKWRHAEEAKRKKDESQQNILRQNSEKRNQEGDDSSDSDIEVTDSPSEL